MIVTVNGKEEKIEVGSTISDFLEGKGQEKDSVVVEHNGNIIKQDNFDNIYLEKHDELEVIKFVGGG